jgi:hypothetical protein
VGINPASWNRTHRVEGTWGAEIIDELKPKGDEHRIVKKGFGGFANTTLDTTLRNMGVTTCVVVGVTTCICVSSTVRGGVEHNYRMIVVSDAVAEPGSRRVVIGRGRGRGRGQRQDEGLALGPGRSRRGPRRGLYTPAPDSPDRPDKLHGNNCQRNTDQLGMDGID